MSCVHTPARARSGRRARRSGERVDERSRDHYGTVGLGESRALAASEATSVRARPRAVNAYEGRPVQAFERRECVELSLRARTCPRELVAA
jgi:hypothetical protein